MDFPLVALVDAIHKDRTIFPLFFADFLFAAIYANRFRLNSSNKHITARLSEWAWVCVCKWKWKIVALPYPSDWRGARLSVGAFIFMFAQLNWIWIHSPCIYPVCGSRSRNRMRMRLCCIAYNMVLLGGSSCESEWEDKCLYLSLCLVQTRGELPLEPLTSSMLMLTVRIWFLGGDVTSLLCQERTLESAG